MTAALQHTDRHVIAARVVGEVEGLLRRGLVHPTKQAELARLVRQFNDALDGQPTPEDAAREEGRAI